MSAIDWLRAEWDRILGFVCIGAGGLLVLVGYLGASDSTHTPEALSYLISGGVGGLFLLGAGATLLLSADLHDEWRKLDRLEDAFRSGAMRSSPAPASGDDDTGLDLTERGTSNRDADGGNRTARPQKAVRAQAMEAASPGATAVSRDNGLVHRVRALTAAGLGVALLPIAFGWNHAATRNTDGPAMDGVSMAVGGLILAGLTVAVSTGWMRRTVQSRAGRLLGPFFATLDRMTNPSDCVSGEPVSQLDRSKGKVLVAEGLSRYHAPGCPAVAGAAAGVREVARADVPPALSPCQLCLAD